MSQSRMDVRDLAALARLALGGEEAAVFQQQLDAVLEHASILAKADVSEVCAGPSPETPCGLLREDEPGGSLAPEILENLAPDFSEGQVRVPKIVADA